MLSSNSIHLLNAREDLVDLLRTHLLDLLLNILVEEIKITEFDLLANLRGILVKNLNREALEIFLTRRQLAENILGIYLLKQMIF